MLIAKKLVAIENNSLRRTIFGSNGFELKNRRQHHHRNQPHKNSTKIKTDCMKETNSNAFSTTSTSNSLRHSDRLLSSEEMILLLKSPKIQSMLSKNNNFINNNKIEETNFLFGKAKSPSSKKDATKQNNQNKQTQTTTTKQQNQQQQNEEEEDEPDHDTDIVFDPGNQVGGFLENGISVIYVRTIKSFANNFIMHIQEPEIWKDIQLETPIPWGYVQDQVQSKAQELCTRFCNQNKHEVDSAFLSHVSAASVVLATYKVLALYMEDSTDVYDVLKQCLSYYVRGWLQDILIAPSLLQKAIPSLSSMLESAARVRGQGFVNEIARCPSDSFVELRIRKCLFFSFFNFFGMTYLTPIFCNAEKTLMDKFDPTQHNIRFQLRSTIADGKNRCSFRFNRMERLKNARLVTDNI